MIKLTSAIVKEGGNVFGTTSPIAKADIEPTLEVFVDKLSKLFPAKASTFKQFEKLGSVGKKELSGDIDLAYDVKNFFPDGKTPDLKGWGLDEKKYNELVASITKRAKTASPEKIKLRAIIALIGDKINDAYTDIEVDIKGSGSGALFCSIQQYDTEKNPLPKYVQTDVNIGNLDWLTFSYYSNTYAGNVKGLHRTQLMLSLFANKDYTFGHGTGVVDKATGEQVASNSQEAINLLNKVYGFNLDRDTLNDYFKLGEYLRANLPKEEYNKIIDRYLKILDSTRADIPEDLQDYWITNQEKLGLKGKYLPDDSKLIKYQTLTESGSIGADRIPSRAVKATVESFVDRVLKKYPLYKSHKITGSYNIIPKDEDGNVVGGKEKPEGHGDIDLVVELTGDRADIKQIKADFANYLKSLSDDITVPFRSGRHEGKKIAGTGDIVITQYTIEGFPDLTVQIDNMIVVSPEELTYRSTFLDIPGERQALLIGLAKVMCIEENPYDIFKRLNITNLPQLKDNQEFEFVLSSKGLTLRVVTLDGFKELDRKDIWASYKWSDVEKLFQNYNINGTFKELLNDIVKKIKNPRSKNRIKGTFKSMLVINSGEVGTPKGANKQMALDTVASLEEKYGSFITNLIRPILEAEIGKQTIAVFPGAFKPPHASHLKAIQVIAPKVNKVYVYVSKQPRTKEGQVSVDASQAMAVWDLYKQKGLLPDNVEIKLAENPTPVLDAYQEMEAHPENKYLAVFGKDEEDRWRSVEKNREKYSNVTPVNIGNLKGLSASGLRTAIKNKDLQAIETFLPKGVTAKEYIQALTKGKKEDLTESYKGKRTDNGAPGTFKAKITKAYGGDVTIEKAKKFKNRENATPLDKQQANWFINFHSKNESVTPAELKQADAFADTQLAPIDVDLTSKHVFDRLTGRESDISFAQLIGFFKRLGRNKKEFFDFFQKYDEIVANDKTTNLNIPFLTMTNKAIAKTIMRKPNFMTSSPKMTFEEEGKAAPYGSGYEPLEELVTDTEVICDNCGWTWKIADGGDDLYICHNTLPGGSVCGHDNSPDLEEASEQTEGLYTTSFTFEPPIQKELEPLIEELTNYMVKQGLNITPAPEVQYVEDEDNAKNTLGRTAYYDPNNKLIVLYITGRHPKDILRSFAHEMIHHCQNLEGRLEGINTTNINEDDYLADIESEAYNNGNMIFRSWENDREGNNSIRNMTGFAPGSYDMQPINEGAYDSITRTVVKDIMAAWKEEYDGVEGTLSFNEEYETQDAKGRPLDFILSADLLVQETEEGIYKVDGGADAESQKGDDDDEDDVDFAYLEIRFQVDPRSLPQFWSRIYEDLIDVVRHEIEHLTQMGVNVVPAKETPDDEMLRQMIDWELLPKADYFRLQSELEPMLQGMYLKAKKTRTPFKDVLNTYLDMQDITPEEKESILNLWRTKIKPLSLPEF